MKAIYTHYVGATERKPARIIASDMDDNRVTVPADGDFPYDERHRYAAQTLCMKMGWKGGETLVGGSLKHGMAWVFLPPAAERTTAAETVAATLAARDREREQQHNASCTGTLQPPVWGEGDRLWICDVCSFALEKLR